MLRFATLFILTFGAFMLDKPPASLSYRILRLACTDNDKCLAIAVISPKHFNRMDMEGLGRTLSEEYKEKVTITVLFFDNAKIARQFIQGKREWRDHQIDGRGKYLRSGSEEYIQFSPSRANPFGLVTISLRKS
jgi:hypothetical protein